MDCTAANHPFFKGRRRRTHFDRIHQKRIWGQFNHEVTQLEKAIEESILSQLLKTDKVPYTEAGYATLGNLFEKTLKEHTHFNFTNVPLAVDDKDHFADAMQHLHGDFSSHTHAGVSKDLSGSRVNAQSMAHIMAKEDIARRRQGHRVGYPILNGVDYTIQLPGSVKAMDINIGVDM